MNSRVPFGEGVSPFVYEQMVNAVRDYAIFAIDREGNVLTWNPGAERLKGYQADEIIGKNFSVFYTAEDLARSHPQHELAIAADVGRYEDEGWRVRKDGTRFWANVLISAIRGPNGDLIGYSKVTRDLTERRSNELKIREAKQNLEAAVLERTEEIERVNNRLSELLEESRQNESQLRTLADSIPQLCWMADSNGFVFWFNKKWYEFTGTTEAQMAGWGWQSVHDPQAQPRVLAKWLASLATGEPFEMTFSIKAADGRFRWFLTRVLPVRNTQGFIVRWIGTSTDVDESRRQSLALKESEERLKLATESAQIGTWSWTPRDNLLQWSETMKKIFDFSFDEFPERVEGIWRRVHPEDKETLEKAMRETVANKRPYDVEYRIIWKDQTVHWVASKGLAYHSEVTSEVERMFGVAFDITEKKRAHDELQKSADHFRRAVQMRDDFLSIASHELKTPLTSLKLQLQILKRTSSRSEGNPLTEEQLLPVTALFDRQVERLLRLIDDMLDISRIRSGKLSIQREEVELCALVKDVVEKMSSQFTLAGYAAPELKLRCPVRGNWDRLRLEQVLNNLLSNAIKYGRRGPVTVSVTSENNLCRLSVADRGIGISEDFRERIFGRFERDVDLRKYAGLGLGLFITQQIVLALHGTIRVESEAGIGSTFIVELPLDTPSSGAPS